MPAPKDPEKRALWKQRLSQSHMGKQINLGRVQSEATKAKISETLKEHQLTPEQRERQLEGAQRFAENATPEQRKKMGWRKGATWTDEVKQKISESNKGRVSPMKGRKFTEEEKAAKYAFTKRPGFNKGRPMPEHVKQLLFSPEITAKRAESYSKNFATMTPEERVARLEVWIEAGRKGNKGQDTSIERFVAQQFDILQINYKQQKRIGSYFVDFFIPADNLIIEVNGCFWHGCEQCGFNEEMHYEKRAHDAKRIAYLESEGYTVGIIWEHDLRPFMEN